MVTTDQQRSLGPVKERVQLEEAAIAGPSRALELGSFALAAAASVNSSKSRDLVPFQPGINARPFHLQRKDCCLAMPSRTFSEGWMVSSSNCAMVLRSI